MKGSFLAHFREAFQTIRSNEGLFRQLITNKFSFEHPVNMGFSAGPQTNDIFKLFEHERMMNAFDILPLVEARFAQVFGREYTGPLELYRAEDAEYVVVTLGSIAGLVCDVVDELREAGIKAGCIRIRYLRPFPDEQLVAALAGKKACTVLEKDISFGYEGTVFTNVCSALYSARATIEAYSAVGGLGGRDITAEHIHTLFATMREGGNGQNHMFLGLGVQ